MELWSWPSRHAVQPRDFQAGTKRIQNCCPLPPWFSQSSSPLCSWLQWESFCKAVVGLKKKHLWGEALLLLPPQLPLQLPPPLQPLVLPVAIPEMLTNVFRPMKQPTLLLLTLLPLVQPCRPMLLVSSTLPVVKTLAPDLDCKTPLMVWHRLVQGAMLWRVAPPPERPSKQGWKVQSAGQIRQFLELSGFTEGGVMYRPSYFSAVQTWYPSFPTSPRCRRAAKEVVEYVVPNLVRTVLSFCNQNLRTKHAEENNKCLAWMRDIDTSTRMFIFVTLAR